MYPLREAAEGGAGHIQQAVHLSTYSKALLHLVQEGGTAGLWQRMVYVWLQVGDQEYVCQGRVWCWPSAAEAEQGEGVAGSACSV